MSTFLYNSTQIIIQMLIKYYTPSLVMVLSASSRFPIFQPVVGLEEGDQTDNLTNSLKISVQANWLVDKFWRLQL